MHQFILHLVAAQQRHDDEGVGVHVEQIEALDGVGRLRAQRQRGVVGHVRRELSHVVHHPVHLLDLQLQPAVDLLGLLHAELVLFHQLVDVEAVTLGRRDTAGTGVGLLQIAEARQLGQLVADRGGADVQPALFHQQLAAHRLCRGDVLVDDRGQDLLFSLADLSHCAHPVQQSFDPNAGTLLIRVLIYYVFPCLSSGCSNKFDFLSAMIILPGKYEQICAAL